MASAPLLSLRLLTPGCVTACCRISSSQFTTAHKLKPFGVQLIGCIFWQHTSCCVVHPAVVGPSYPVPKHIKKPDYVTTGIIPDWGDCVEIKDEDQIQGLRQACQLARQILLLAGSSLKVGMTTEELDYIVHHEAIRNNAYPSPLGYGGFPKSVCTSVNNVVCHGIPDSRPLQNGDIINIDVTVYFNGYHGDTSETFLVGNVDKSGQKLVEVARRCRNEAIAVCRPGAPLNVIGNTIRDRVVMKRRWPWINSLVMLLMEKSIILFIMDKSGTTQELFQKTQQRSFSQKKTSGINSLCCRCASDELHL
ncbi:methionine aminopeptidase 1D, mitochondrial isoform X4 [Rhincodon typus]|uniref:methionine aminopeptidase 1D, mitochondrial isoform X4 n=1 Tax=Rhincodon typus TaxID=259920 RepID=UPI00202E9014|nr:methionine aminopeptidase 1D, mitochondrial isoform X4 [Rhincodon typus]